MHVTKCRTYKLRIFSIHRVCYLNIVIIYLTLLRFGACEVTDDVDRAACIGAALEAVDAVCGSNLATSRTDIYTIEYDGTFDCAEISALVLTHFGLFGNSVIQLLHIFNMAEALNVGRVYLPAGSPFQVDQSTRIGALEICPAGTVRPAIETRLIGVFFDAPPLGVISDMDGDRRQVLGRRYLLPIYRSTAMPVKLGADDLVVHFRAGDIFAGVGNVHRDYAQPPLSFYVSAVERHLANYPSAKLHVIAQDDTNPCVVPFLTIINKRRWSATTRVAERFEEDRSILLAAGHIVCSFGTLPLSLMAMSEALKSVYAFRAVTVLGTQFLSYLPSTIQATVAEPRVPYLVVGDWQNTDEQRNLMLTYPSETLVWYSLSTMQNPHSSIWRKFGFWRACRAQQFHSMQRRRNRMAWCGITALLKRTALALTALFRSSVEKARR